MNQVNNKSIKYSNSQYCIKMVNDVYFSFGILVHDLYKWIEEASITENSIDEVREFLKIQL